MKTAYHKFVFYTSLTLSFFYFLMGCQGNINSNSSSNSERKIECYSDSVGTKEENINNFFDKTFHRCTHEYSDRNGTKWKKDFNSDIRIVYNENHELLIYFGEHLYEKIDYVSEEKITNSGYQCVSKQKERVYEVGYNFFDGNMNLVVGCYNFKDGHDYRIYNYYYLPTRDILEERYDFMLNLNHFN